MRGPARLAVAAGFVLAFAGPGVAVLEAQSLPARVRAALSSAGHDELVERLSDRMGPRSHVDEGDVEDLLERWERIGGPGDDWDWLTVSRLWVRAGDAEKARTALARVGPTVPPGLRALEAARVEFLAGDAAAGDRAYWEACELADEASALEAWRDIEVLATPGELEAWDRLRRLPAGQRDNCGFFRRFWNERAGRSGVPVDERIALHYERLRYAMDHYVRRGRAQDVAASGKLNRRLGREGAPRFDDRGLLYLRMGPPDETARTIGGDCYEPNVTWLYRFPDGSRMYHLSPLGGNDNWWMLSNLGEIFRCQLTPGGRVRTDRNPMVAPPPLLDDIPAEIMYDIYITRGQLDPAYASLAYRFDGRRNVEVLQDERDRTWEDGRYAVTEVPERPDVKMDLGLVSEWVAFRLPVADATRMWLLLAIDGDDLAQVEAPPEDGYEVIVTALNDDGRLERRSGRLAPPAPGLDALVRIPFDLSPGAWDTRVLVRAGPPRSPGDEDRPPASGGFTSGSVPVPSFQATLPRLSGIAVSPDSGGNWAQTSEVSLSPSPVHVTNPAGKLWIYFEAYNLTPGGRYTANVHLERVEGGAAYDLDFNGMAPLGGRVVTPSGLRLDLAAARPGLYRLRLTVRDQATGRVTLPADTRIRVREGAAAAGASEPAAADEGGAS